VAELARLAVPAASVRLVPPGTDTGLFQPDGPAAARGQRTRLLMFSTMADGTEVAIGIHTLTHLPDAELVVAGGPASSKAGRDRTCRSLTRLARQLGVADRLTFTGKLTRAAAPALMRSADLLLSLSPWRLSGTVTLDAMACGVPVLACPAGLAEDAVIDGVTGFLLPSAAPTLLAGRIHALLASPMIAEGYGIAAACRARERYTWTRIARETLTAYQSLAATSAHAA
jgi:glycosyltransferase involved in cell wall biosynthesis